MSAIFNLHSQKATKTCEKALKKFSHQKVFMIFFHYFMISKIRPHKLWADYLYVHTLPWISIKNSFLTAFFPRWHYSCRYMFGTKIKVMITTHLRYVSTDKKIRLLFYVSSWTTTLSTILFISMKSALNILSLFFDLIDLSINYDIEYFHFKLACCSVCIELLWLTNAQIFSVP